MGRIIVSGRVSIDFEVDEEAFNANPDNAVQDAINNGKASFTNDDNYLPQPWNEGLVEEDEGFSIPSPAISVCNTFLRELPLHTQVSQSRHSQ